MLCHIPIIPTHPLLRKVDIEDRAFNPAWKEKWVYFFAEGFGQVQRLLCLKTVAVLKAFNMHRHWEAEHRTSNCVDVFRGEERRHR